MASKYDQLQSFTSGYEKHPEQGLKTCKKKLQKDPSSTIYLLAQARFLLRLERHQEALESCLAIKFASNEVPEAFIIPEIQEITVSCQHALATFNYSAAPKLAALWKDALDKSKGRDGREMRACMFRAAWRDEYWDLAQQLFARLQKEFPDVPRYHFAWIVLTQLQTSKMAKDDKMAQNLQLLAFRSLKAAIDNTLNKKDTVRKITSTHDLRLITQIYLRQGYREELIAILQDPVVGVTSPVSKNDIEFVRREIELLGEENRFKELHGVCYSKMFELSKVKSNSTKNDGFDTLSWVDDWFMWTALLKSTEQLNDAETTSKTTELVHSFLASDPRNRNAGRLRLTHHARLKHNLLDACINYFDSSCTGRSCFEDLREFLPQISWEEQKVYLEHINAAAKENQPPEEGGQDVKQILNWIAVETNALKFEYFLCISKAALPTRESLESFVADAIQVYKISLNASKDGGDEACFLAVIALVKLYHFSRDFAVDDSISANQTPAVLGQSYLVQAICLLDFLRSNSPHNYGAMILSILICQQLGLTSRSMKLMKELRIKEVQHDTVDHLLFSRISITHPFPTAARHISALSSRYKDPYIGLKISLDWYGIASEKMMHFMGDELESIQFDKILEFSEFKEKFENSYCRALMLLEYRRVGRLTDVQGAVGGLPPQFEKWVFDNRDFDTIPDFEYPTTSKFESFITTRPRPDKYWLARHTINDLLQTLMFMKAPYPASQLRILTNQIAYLASKADDKPYQLTPSEQLVSVGWDHLQPLIVALTVGASFPHSSSNIKRDCNLLLDWLKDTNCALPSPGLLPQSDVLQDMFLRLEILKACDKFCDVALAASKQKGHAMYGKFPTDVVQKTKSTTSDNAKAIRNHARDWKRRLEKDGKTAVLDLLKAGTTGDDVCGLLEGWVTNVEIVESAIDALDGLTKVKVGAK